MQDEIVTVEKAAQMLSRWFVSGLPTGELDKTFGQRNYASQDPETGEPYEPTPGNVEIARRDVLFVKTASEFEGWILACIEDAILVPRSNASRGYAPGFARLGRDALVSLCEAQGALANRYNVRFPQPASANGTVPAEHDELVVTEKAAPPAIVVTNFDTTGMVAWQAAVLESWKIISEMHQNKTTARHVMAWCKSLKSPRDIFKCTQPQERDSMSWIDRNGGVHTVTYGRIATVISEWRKDGKIPAKK